MKEKKMSDEEENELIERAKQFEELVSELENKQTVFSKKQLETYHSKIEAEMDEKMVEFEDSLVKENSQPTKEHHYIKLFAFLRS